jgi:hypothetical protein
MEAKKKKQLKRTTKKAVKKPAVLRYHAPKTNKTFDEGVPASHLNFSNQNLNKPTIKSTEQIILSPFVVSFSTDKPTTAEETAAARLNFLIPENELQIKATEADEFLLPEELTGQLLEDERTPQQLERQRPMATPIWPSLETIRAALEGFREQKEIVEPMAEAVDLTTFQPQTKKEPVFLKVPLDLPEMEEDESDEAEVLTWDEVVRSTLKEKEDEETNEEKSIAWREWWKTVRVPLHFGSLEFSAGWHRALVVFVLLSFVFVLPLHAMETINDLRGAKNNLSAAGVSAVSKLNEAVSLITINSASAETSFAAAKEDFGAAHSILDDLGAAASFLLSVLPSTHTTYTSGLNLILAGEKISAAGEKISQGLSAAQNDGLDTTGKLAILTETFKKVLPTLEEAENNLNKVDPKILPVEYQTRFTELQNLLPTFLATAKDITEFSGTLSNLLGAEGKKRYLLLFQNNSEIRPSGGFLGSFAVLDIWHGEVTNLEVPAGGSYDLQGSLKKNIISPLPLQLLSARWEFQDSNWFPDFPTSARQALDFYYSAGGPTVDGVVAVNATFISSLLALLGPVEMEEYERTIDSENFLFETQKMVEYDYVAYSQSNSERAEAAPKAFVGDLAAALLERIKGLETTTLLQTLEAGQKALAEKEIQFYSPDEATQRIARRLGWTGEVKQTGRDYLMVIDTNLGGGKTDLVIDEQINLNAAVQEDGRIINTLTITRAHHGLSGAIFTGVNNVDFMRVYVPRGSRLISASGFTIPDVSLFESPGEDWQHDADVLFTEENTMVDQASGTMVSEEFGKTVFGNWVQTRPGETSTAVFVYELPFTISSGHGLIQAVKNKIGLNSGPAYSLLIQKQSGLLNRQTTATVSAPDRQILWSSSDKNIFTNKNDSFMSILFAN